MKAASAAALPIAGAVLVMEFRLLGASITYLLHSELTKLSECILP
jgi:hypothetical protein